MKLRKISLPVIVLAALILAGCKFQSTTTIQPGGAGELRSEVGFSAEERQNLEKQNPVAAQDFCNTQASHPGNVTITEEKRGTDTWCITTNSFNNLDQLRKLYLQKKGIQINRLEISGGTFYYDLSIDTSSRDSDFSGFTSITWVLVLPDQPTAQNADEVEGNTLTWHIAPLSGVRDLQAESKISPSLIAIVIAIVLLALVVGGIIFVVRRRKNQPENS
jgi:hypothetical protein